MLSVPKVRPARQWPRGPFNELHAAAMRGSAEWTLAVLSKGVIDINQGNEQGCTPLMLAASDGFARVVKILLSRGANVSVESNDGFTALLLAASDGYLDVCKLLVEAGSDLEVATPTMGSTPLHLAGEVGNLELARVLINAGADVDTRRPDGASVLFTAAEKGHLSVVQALLHAGADALLFRTDRRTGATYLPVDTAAQNGHLGVVRELVGRLGVRGCGGDSGGVNALRLAARGQHLDIMSVLTGAGVVDTGGALINAAECGRDRSVLYLLRQHGRQSGALALRDKKGGAGGAGKPYVETNDSLTGTTPLFICVAFCAFNAPRVARALIDAGANTTAAVRMRHVPGATDTPLAIVERYLIAKNVNGRPASEAQLLNLRAIRRLLLQVPAARAVSWPWPKSAAAAAAPAASSRSAREGAGVTGAVRLSASLASTLPSLRRRARRRGVVLASLFRHSRKP